MTDVHVTVWDDRDDVGGADTPALFVHNIFTWGDDPEYGFAGQRALAGGRRLLLMDRRGYGDSPDTVRGDFEVDAGDVVGLLDSGAHLVGHGNGGVVALLAAARRPDLVRSLALIQPSAFTAAADRPVVAGLLDRVRGPAPAVADDVTPERFLRESTESVGLPVPPLRYGFG